MNKVILIGRLGQDPELRFTQSGQAVMNMRVATNKKWRDRESGERKEHTEWHTVVMWGSRAEALSKFLRKGSQLCAEGELQTRQWDDKEGNKRYSTEVKAYELELLGGERGHESNEYKASEPNGPAPSTISDDDIPF